MAKKKREVPEVNSSSTADIAFSDGNAVKHDLEKAKEYLAQSGKKRVDLSGVPVESYLLGRSAEKPEQEKFQTKEDGKERREER